jgi:hypothetical protein
MKITTYISDKALEPIVQNLDLVLRAKNTNVITLLVRNEDDESVDITSSTIFFTVKTTTSIADASASLKKDVTSHTYPESGETEITLTSTDTSSLLGSYLYSIKIKLTTGKIYTLAEGVICFQQELATRES